MSVNDHLNRKKTTNGQKDSSEKGTVRQSRGEHQEGAIHSEKIRYKNADEIYE